MSWMRAKHFALAWLPVLARRRLPVVGVLPGQCHGIKLGSLWISPREEVAPRGLPVVHFSTVGPYEAEEKALGGRPAPGSQAHIKALLAELEIVDDPFTTEQHALWNADIMTLIRLENMDLSGSKFDVLNAFFILCGIIKPIVEYVKAPLQQMGPKLRLVIIEHERLLLPALKEAIMAEDFTDFRSLAIFRQQPTPVFSSTSVVQGLHTAPSSWAPPMSSAELDNAISTFSQEIEPDLRQYIASNCQDFSFPSLPASTLFIDGMGGMYAKDAALRKRVDALFAPRNLKLLFNTSGSGKTALLIEGLCHHWGLYITSFVDERTPLGSVDAEAAWLHILGNAAFDKSVNLTARNNKLKTNIEIIQGEYSLMLLARLSIFQLFLHCTPADHDEGDLRHLWLYLQLCPSALRTDAPDDDIFYRLYERIRPAENYEPLGGRIIRLLMKIREDTHIRLKPIFLTLDEAQLVSQRVKQAFYSSRPGANQQSVLREIHDTWANLRINMIFAGTGLPLDPILLSSVTKDSLGLALFSDTGSFDDKESQRSYIMERVQPNHIDERTLERAWHWLRGRHRFTATYTLLLQKMGVASANKILNAFIEHITGGFEPTDGRDIVKNEPDIDTGPVYNYTPVDFSKLGEKRHRRMVQTIFQATVGMILRNRPYVFFETDFEAITLGFARVMPETKSLDLLGIRGQLEMLPQVIDEPLMVAAALHYFETLSVVSIRTYATESLRRLEPPSTRGFAMENVTMVAFLNIFDDIKSLADVFTVHNDEGQSWLKKPARLVSITRRKRNGDFQVAATRIRQGATPLLSCEASKLEDFELWLEGMKGVFCFLDNNMGPDIIFLVQCGTRLVWVMVQVKCLSSQGPTPRKTMGAQHTLEPTALYLGKDGQKYSAKCRPNFPEETLRRMNIPNIPVVRLIVSFPAQSKEEILEEEGSTNEVVASFDDLAQAESFEGLSAMLSNYLSSA